MKESRPTEALLLEWGVEEEATLNSLLKALQAIGRVDVYQQLQDVLGFHIEGFDQVKSCSSSFSIFRWFLYSVCFNHVSLQF